MVFAEIDGTKNEVEGMSIEGFPTIFFHFGWEKEDAYRMTTKFQESLTKENIIKFLLERMYHKPAESLEKYKYLLKSEEEFEGESEEEVEEESVEIQPTVSEVEPTDIKKPEPEMKVDL